MSNELMAQEMRTPIEVALEMTEDGMVSAKKLYEFLELAPTQYARWCKDNITENPLVDENVDFKPFRHDVENPLGGRPSDDYLLTIEFAKELCMTCHSEKGRLAREYFKKTEQALVVSVKQYNQLVKTTALLSKRVEQLGLLVESSVKELKEEVFSHIDVLEEKEELGLSSDVEWANEMMVHVRKIVEKYPGMDQKKCMDRLVERSEDYMYETYETLLADYAFHHDGKKAKKILVMARDEDTRNAFERAIKDYEIDAGIYEQNEGQKFLEKIINNMGEVIVPDPPEHQPVMSDEKLADMWADMTRMYGEGWDAPQNYSPDDAARDY